MHRLLLQPRWLRAIGLALLFTVVCALLADWQLHRREAKLAAIALVTDNYSRSPVPVGEVLPSPGAALPPRGEWTPVRARGVYAPRETLLVRNRSDDDGANGYLVLVPLRLDGGGTLLVDRGWVATGPTPETSSPVPAPPSGEVEVVARLHPPEPADPRGAPRGQVQTIDLAGSVTRALAATGAQGRQDATVLMRGGYGELARERLAPATAPPKASARPQPDEGPHLAYAVQWWLFAVAAWAFVVVHMRRSAYEQDVAAGRREPRADVVLADPDRRLRDEEVEDALLDANERAWRAAVQARVRAELAARGEPGRSGAEPGRSPAELGRREP